ncbi:hypothetical protein GQ600_15751 [Phytophthora cactorum]|nr:hypothetical protein GQ600_15751 [Phytophthora cactorum]
MPPRRPRSRSPPSNYTVEVPENRRRRLLAEKVMSLEMYHRLLQDPKSPWTKTSGIGTTAIPVPLAPNENTGDYQQKFEFWLAQRNVTLASLRDNVIQERNYRCGYAQWRVQKTYGRPPARKSSSAYDRQRSRSRSLEQYRKYPSVRPRSPEKNSTYQRESQSYNTSASATSTAGSSRFYDVRRQVSRGYIGYRDKGLKKEACCKNCDRKWDDLNRRLKQLESIEREITPTDSDTNHEGPPTAEDLDEPIAEPGDDLESKSPPKLMLLINAYNQLNDGVLTKQKEEDNMVTDMELGIDDKTNSVKLRSQIYKLRDAIKRQKDKRDAAIAAIIVHTHAEKHAELEQQLQKIAASGVSNEQEDLHDKCAGIAAKLAEKDKELARLQKQLLSLIRYP